MFPTRMIQAERTYSGLCVPNALAPQILPHLSLRRLCSRAFRRQIAAKSLYPLQEHAGLRERKHYSNKGSMFAILILLTRGVVKDTQLSQNGNEVLLRFSGRGDIVNIITESPSRTHSCTARATKLT